MHRELVHPVVRAATRGEARARRTSGGCGISCGMNFDARGRATDDARARSSR